MKQRLTQGERLALALRELEKPGVKSATVLSETDNAGRPQVVVQRRATKNA